MQKPIENDLTEAPLEPELQLKLNSEFVLNDAVEKQTASPTSNTIANKEILEHRQEKEMQAQSDKSVIINPILVGSEVWRDRCYLCLLESPPDPRHSEQYIRCDTLCLPEQISLSKRRLEICSGQISEYRDCLSRRKPHSSGQLNLVEKLMKSAEREIVLEQQYVDFLINPQSSAEHEVAPSGLLQDDRSDCETVSDQDRATSPAKDSALVLVLEQLSLNELASVINKEHQLFQGDYKSSLLHAYKAGQFLLEAKSKVKESPTGRWLHWLQQNCPDISERTARNYMQIARKWEKIEKTATVADFGVKGALKLLGEGKKSSLQGSKPSKRSKPSNGEPDVIDAEWEDTFSPESKTGISITNNVHETAHNQHSAIEKTTEKNESLGLNTRDNQALNETLGLTDMNLDMKYNYSSLSNMDDNTFATSSQTIPNNLNDLCILINSNIKHLNIQQLATLIETFENHLKAETFNRLVVESISQYNMSDLCNKCLEFMDEQAYSRLTVEKIKFSKLSNPSLNFLNKESQRILDERTA